MFAILVWAIPTGEESATLFVKARLELPHGQVRLLDHDLQWQFAGVLAMHPDGNRVAHLVPLSIEEGLRRRGKDERPERKFRLQWVNLSDGSISHSVELLYRVGPQFGEVYGFSLSSDGRALCTVADDTVLVFRDDLKVLGQLPGLLKIRGKGRDFQVASCEFLGESGRLLLELRTPERQEWKKSAIIVYDLASKTSVFEAQFDTLVWDAVSIENTRFALINLEPASRWHYRVAEIDATRNSRRPIWKAIAKENGHQRLLSSQNRIFRGEWLCESPSDVVYVSWADPSKYYDYEDRPDMPMFPLPGLTGRVRSWLRSTGKSVEYSLPGHYVMWPLAVSVGETWLAARAVRFRSFELAQYRWDDNRFVIFDISKPKKPIYVSENFGPEEAITGLAFTPDRKTLVVATSRRLLIYDVRESPAN